MAGENQCAQLIGAEISVQYSLKNPNIVHCFVGC
jgi:hypothetical protein